MKISLIGALVAGASVLLCTLDRPALAADCREDPTLIIPGKCVGPISGALRFRDAKRVLAGHRLKPAWLGAEGDYQCATVVDSGTPTEAYILWASDLAHPELSEDLDLDGARKQCPARDFGNATAISVHIRTSEAQEPPVYSGVKMTWHTAEGIRVGTDLHKLRKIAPGDFTVSGYAWDYGGRISIGMLTMETDTDETRYRQLTEQQRDSIEGEDKKLRPTDAVLDFVDPFVSGFFVDLVSVREH